ncbi:hypothetical protein FXO38_02327 [Capsicum annuum]|nr:hypothetical protein FXO38_02327 [Capsicum annuum]
MDEADKDTSPHQSTPMFVHDFDKNSEGTLDKTDTCVHEARDVCDSPNTEGATKMIENTSADDMEKPKLNEQTNSQVHTLEAVSKERKAKSDLRDSQVTILDELLPSLNAHRIDVCLYYLRKKSKYDPNSSYKFSIVDCNFMNIVSSVLYVYAIDDPTLNSGEKKYHLNEYISGFCMHATVSWHKVDHIFMPISIKDCGLYMMTYAECLTIGGCVPNVNFDLDILHMRYASMLWHYGMRKKEEKA